MATRYTYQTQRKMNNSENFITYHLENIEYIRLIITACLILTPVFVVI